MQFTSPVRVGALQSLSWGFRAVFAYLVQHCPKRCDRFGVIFNSSFQSLTIVGAEIAVSNKPRDIRACYAPPQHPAVWNIALNNSQDSFAVSAARSDPQNR